MALIKNILYSLVFILLSIYIYFNFIFLPKINSQIDFEYNKIEKNLGFNVKQKERLSNILKNMYINQYKTYKPDLDFYSYKNIHELPSFMLMYLVARIYDGVYNKKENEAKHFIEGLKRFIILKVLIKREKSEIIDLYFL